MKPLEKALELASQISHPVTAAVFTAVIAAILFTVAAYKKRWGLAFALGIVVLISGISPIIASTYIQHEHTYHVRISVLNEAGELVNEATVSSQYGEAPMRGPGRWEVDIASQLKPSDGKVTFYADVRESYLTGSSMLELKDDWFPQVQIRLHPLPSVLVRGVVEDALGRSVSGAKISIIGYPDVAISDGMGNFALSAHAAGGQMVTIRAENGTRSVQDLVPAGPGIVLVLR